MGGIGGPCGVVRIQKIWIEDEKPRADPESPWQL